MRTLFCGTPAFAVPTLTLLLRQTDFKVLAVVTQPDRPRGRRQEITSPPVKNVALEAGLHVYQPEGIKSDSAYEFVERMQPDVVVMIAYGQIIPPRLLNLPRYGWINLHASLLPNFRGAAPIHWAIARGETRTGLTTMQVDAGMDTGPILLQKEVEIGSHETAPELTVRMAEQGAPLMLESLRRLARGDIVPVPQDASRATRAPLLKKEDGRISWAQSAQEIYNRMRGFQPWPGAFTNFRGGRCHPWGWPAASVGGPPGALFVEGHEVYVGCGMDTRLRLESVQLEGRKKIGALDFVNGARLKSGERFMP